MYYNIKRYSECPLYPFFVSVTSEYYSQYTTISCSTASLLYYANITSPAYRMGNSNILLVTDWQYTIYTNTHSINCADRSVVVINTICSGWYTLLSYTPWDGLFAISACSAIINSILLLITIYTAYIAVRMPARTGAVWCLIITLSCYGLLYVRDLSRQGIIPLNNISPGLLLLYKSKITALIQYGPISNSAHNSSWIQYTLLPALIRESGAQKIQYLILTNLNRNSYALATQLIAHNIVNTIITVESPHAINPVALRWACNRAHIPYCHITRTHSIYKLTEQYIVKYT